MSSKIIKGLLAAVFLSVAGIACSNPPAPVVAEPLFKFGVPKKMTPQQMEGMVGAITEIARETYIDPERSGNNDELTSIALKAIVSSLDPHSTYMTQQDLERFMNDNTGKFGGIGAELGLDKDKNIIVIEPSTNSSEASPAQKASLKANDVIIEVNDKSVVGADLAETIGKIRGEEGTSVKLTVRRPGVDAPIPLTIVRAAIKTSAIKTAAIGNDIAYIRLSNFMQNNLTAEFQNAVNGLNAKMGSTVSSYILDLRNNGGGSLNDAVNIAADLLNTDETIVTTRGKNPSDNKEFNGINSGYGTMRRIVDLTHGKPIVILVNEGSASASEVLSGALQDLAPERVTILGKTTFGKGLVQQIMPLKTGRFDAIFEKHGISSRNIPGGAIKLTTAHYYTPSGRSIHNVGVPPDVVFIPNVTKKADEPDSERMSEATLPRGLSRPGDAKADENKTTRSCTPQLDVKVRDGFDKILKDRDGNVFPEILCAIDALRKTHQWTNIAPYTPPAVKAPAPSPTS